MHTFLGKILGENIFTPKDSKNQKLFQKLLTQYRKEGVTVKLSLEPVSKNINKEQRELYRAFILKSMNFFGEDSFKEMENNLEHLMPDKPLNRWTTRELSDFIDRASAFLARFGFNF